MNRLVYLIPFLLTAASCAQEPLDPDNSHSGLSATAADAGDVVFHEVTLGDSTVAIEEHGGGDGLSILILGSGDSTAYDVGVSFTAGNGGRMVAVRTNEDFRVSFSVEGGVYSFEPTRVFSVPGIRKSIGSQNTPASFFNVQAYADRILSIYEPDWIVVELTDHRPDDYSARSYQAGGDLADEALAVHVQPGVDPGDFFVAYDSEMYDVLRLAGLNVVRSNSQIAEDDGSLSVWAARNGMRYVRVEASYGHRTELRGMLEGLVGVLEALPSRLEAN